MFEKIEDGKVIHHEIAVDNYLKPVTFLCDPTKKHRMLGICKWRMHQ